MEMQWLDHKQHQCKHRPQCHHQVHPPESAISEAAPQVCAHHQPQAAITSEQDPQPRLPGKTPFDLLKVDKPILRQLVQFQHRHYHTSDRSNPANPKQNCDYMHGSGECKVIHRSGLRRYGHGRIERHRERLVQTICHVLTYQRLVLKNKYLISAATAKTSRAAPINLAHAAHPSAAAIHCSVHANLLFLFEPPNLSPRRTPSTQNAGTGQSDGSFASLRGSSADVACVRISARCWQPYLERFGVALRAHWRGVRLSHSPTRSRGCEAVPNRHLKGLAHPILPQPESASFACRKDRHRLHYPNATRRPGAEGTIL